MSTLDVLRSEAAEYFGSPAGQEMAGKGRSSSLYPLRLVSVDPDVAVWHYHRFVMGAWDAHALAGWGFVMDGRQSDACREGRVLEIAIQAGMGKTA